MSNFFGLFYFYFYFLRATERGEQRQKDEDHDEEEEENLTEEEESDTEVFTEQILEFGICVLWTNLSSVICYSSEDKSVFESSSYRIWNLFILL